jgi:hypothetical protein
VIARQSGDPVALEAALRALGLACAVEARAALALISGDAGLVRRLAASADRRAAIALAKQYGFTHLAVELEPHAGFTRAPVLRD